LGRLVLMGSVGVPITITPGLDAVWGYQRSRGMRTRSFICSGTAALDANRAQRARFNRLVGDFRAEGD